MSYILLLLIFLVSVLILYKYIKSKPQEEQRGYLVKFILILLSAILVFLAISGRIHWLGALMAGLLTVLRFILPIILKTLPFLSQIRTKRKDKPDNDTQMSQKEALKILGLSGKPKEDEIISAHKKLIQKIHPDRGGSEYLATTINLAKDTLLKRR